MGMHPSRMLIIAAALTGCAPSPQSTAAAPAAEHLDSACEQLVTACHKHDAKSPVAHDCHVLGHSKSASGKDCESRLSECLTECQDDVEQ